ncbi:glycosyltransferase [Adhaeribacter swui]|uniref:Glycosyltransferase n=1 Tax=Adhaeribacter swui TaxID=2086471 RepID=A0A7G7G596_9BACT|nr:glycosyltransferase family 2 protein [Adhaeribacter swui]QNF32330.1 glycosyltransferase [Adhaeribacter swui]
MTNNILVSIITPSYNQGSYIEETILSVINQTYKNIQYIVVDGGSSDNTMEIVNKYKDKIDIIIHEKDNGQSEAINKGFKLSKGELVGWINSDDLLYPECVEKIVELYHSKPNGSIYYNAYGKMIDGKGDTIKEYCIIIPNKDYLLNHDYRVSQPGSFYNKAMLKKVNYLDESIHYCMDLDLWLRLLNFAPIYYTTYPPLSCFRIWEETKTSTGGQKFFNDIRLVLLKNGAKKYAKTVVKTYWYSFKARIKDLIK